MKKSLFSLRLYLDGIKQLRIMGVLFTALTAIVAVISPLMAYLNYLDARSYEYYMPSQTTVNCWDMNPLIILLFCAMAPLMTLYLFSFLNKRESADFYHAIPETRQCLFLSFFGSVMTWVFIILTVSTGVAVFFHAIFPQLYLVNYASVFYTCLNCFAGSLFIAAAVAIAMSLTGTVFTNLLVALILIFFPRLLIELAVAGVRTAFPLVNGLTFAPALDASYNVPVGFIFSLFFGSRMELPLTQWESGVYTLAVGLVYTAIALVLFVRRSSESAGRSAPSARLQTLFRVLVGFVISCIPTYGLFDTVMTESNMSLDDMGLMALLYLFALLGALVFEVICTRRFKGLLKKSVSTAVMLLIANAAFFGSMYGFSRAMFTYAPDSEDIAWVSIGDGDASEYSSRKDYFSTATSQVKLTDPVIKEIVAKQLRHSLDLLEISRERYYREATNAQALTVTIKSGLTTRVRSILVYSDDVREISEKLYEVEEFRNAYMTLPETVASITSNGYFYGSVAGSADQRDELYSALKKDVAAMGFENWYNLLNRTAATSGTPVIELYIRLIHDGQWYYFNVPVYADLMPATCDLAVANGNANSNAAGGLTAIRDRLSATDVMEITVFNNGDEPSLTYIVKLDENTVKRDDVTAWLDTLTAANATTDIDTDQLFYYIRADSQTKEYEDGEVFYYIDYESNYCFAKEPAGELPDWLAALTGTDDAVYLK